MGFYPMKNPIFGAYTEQERSDAEQLDRALLEAVELEDENLLIAAIAIQQGHNACVIMQSFGVVGILAFLCVTGITCRCFADNDTEWHWRLAAVVTVIAAGALVMAHGRVVRRFAQAQGRRSKWQKYTLEALMRAERERVSRMRETD